MTHETTAPVQSLVDDALIELENLVDDLGEQAAPAQPAAQVATRREHYKAALEDIAAVLGQSPEWGADQLNEIVAILGREGIPVSE